MIGWSPRQMRNTRSSPSTATPATSRWTYPFGSCSQPSTTWYWRTPASVMGPPLGRAPWQAHDRRGPARRQGVGASARAGRRRRRPGLELLDQGVVGLRLHDLVELGAVVRHQADTLDDHVVDAPGAVLHMHAVVDRHVSA